MSEYVAFEIKKQYEDFEMVVSYEFFYEIDVRFYFSDDDFFHLLIYANMIKNKKTLRKELKKQLNNMITSEQKKRIVKKHINEITHTINNISSNSILTRFIGV